MLATAAIPEYEEARHYFTRLADVGAPRLTSSILFAAGQLPFWRRVANGGSLPFQESQQLEEACVCRGVGRGLVSGSLFSRYSFAQATLDPGKVLGGRKRAAYQHRRGDGRLKW